jgi:hypothetical protein
MPIKGLLFATACACAALAACSSSSSSSTPPPCNDDPFECSSGKTCWAPHDPSQFDCVTSGAGKLGDSCLSVVGPPDCGDGLMCLQLTTQSSGTCTPFCDGSHPCPNGELCAQVNFGGTVTTHACASPQGRPDGGGGGD